MSIIEKLNNIKVEDLKQIKTDDIKTYLLKNLEVSISIVLVLLTLFINFKSMGSYQEELTKLNTDIGKLQETQKAVEIDEKTQKQLDSILSEFPESISINKLSQIITTYASKYNVRIENYTPSKDKIVDGIKINAMSISTEAPSFDAIIGFLKEIESSPYAIRLQNWSGNQGAITKSTQSARNDRINNENISAKISIETYEISE